MDKLGCFFIAKNKCNPLNLCTHTKHPISANFGVFYQKWYADGWAIRLKIGMDESQILDRSSRHINV